MSVREEYAHEESRITLSNGWLAICVSRAAKFLEIERMMMMKNFRSTGESGFTLIELLVVVAIIGILAAIAIPQFAAYRKRGYEATLKADLRNAATSEEAYFAQTNSYKSGSLSSGTPSGYNKSADISSITSAAGSNTFVLTATHSNCTGISWSYSSSTGVATGPTCP